MTLLGKETIPEAGREACAEAVSQVPGPAPLPGVLLFRARKGGGGVDGLCRLGLTKQLLWSTEF